MTNVLLKLSKKNHIVFTLLYQYLTSRRKYRLFYGRWNKKKNTANIYNPFGLGRINRSCMFKRCIEIYPCACTSDKVILKERFVLFYCSYLLNIFIFNVFCMISINHIVALCKNSVNDLCKIMPSLYTFVQALYVHVTSWLSTFFHQITKCYSAARRINEIPVS